MKRAQSFLEYAILISIIAAAFAMMQLYVQRAVKAQLKLIEYQINAEPQ
jgi:hypothetical protein